MINLVTAVFNISNKILFTIPGFDIFQEKSCINSRSFFAP